MPQRRQPDPVARWLSHALVGVTVGYLVGKKTGAAGFWVGAIVSAFAHEMLDAPVEQALSDFGV